MAVSRAWEVCSTADSELASVSKVDILLLAEPLGLSPFSPQSFDGSHWLRMCTSGGLSAHSAGQL